MSNKEEQKVCVRTIEQARALPVADADAEMAVFQFADESIQAFKDADGQTMAVVVTADGVVCAQPLVREAADTQEEQGQEPDKANPPAAKKTPAKKTTKQEK